MVTLPRFTDEQKYRISMGVSALALLLTAPISWNFFDLHLFMLTWSDAFSQHWNVYVHGNSNYPPVATYLFIALEILARETAANPLVRTLNLAEINWVRIVARIPLFIGYLWTGRLLYGRYGWSVTRYWLFTYPALVAALLIMIHPAFTVLTALSWTALIPLSVFFGYQFELVVLPFTLLAMYSLLDEHPGRFGGYLAIATLIKLYPIVLVPLGLARFDWREQTKALGVFAGLVGLVSLPFVLSAPHEFYYHLFGFQSQRFPQGLSPFHLPLLYLQYDVSAFPSVLRWLWQLVWIPLYGCLLLVAWSRQNDRLIVASFAAVLLSLVALNKIGNLNYVAWAWPFLLVLVAKNRISRRYVTGLIITTITYPLAVHLPAAIIDKPIFIVQELKWYEARWLLVNSFRGTSQTSLREILVYLEANFGTIAGFMYTNRFLLFSALIIVHFSLHLLLLSQLARELKAREALGTILRRIQRNPYGLVRSFLSEETPIDDEP